MTRPAKTGWHGSASLIPTGRDSTAGPAAAAARWVRGLAALVVLLFVTAPSAFAQLFTVNVSGTVNWTDGQGNLHAARDDQVQIVGDPPIGSPFIAGTASTDLNGNYTISFSSNAPGLNTYQLQVLASNPAGYVSTDATVGNTYVVPTPTFGLGSGNNTINFNVPNNNNSQTQSLAVVDGILTTYQYAQDARPAAPAPVGVRFPDTGTFFNGAISVLTSDAFDQDVVEHEYGHYLQSIDNLANNPGGSHSWGATNIGLVQTAGGVPLSKLAGIRLAWGEGSATFLGIASQFDNPVGHNLPTNLQNFGDTYFDDFGENVEGKVVNSSLNLAGFDVVTNTGGTIVSTQVPGQGEGDEAPVARILWSISDTTAQPWDRVQRGPVQVYQDLLAAAKANGGTLQTLSQVNNYYLNTVAQNDRQRTNYGAIFQHYGISPSPTGLLSTNPTLNAANPPPTFTWSAGNNGANETFNLIVWNSDPTLSTRIINNFLIPAASGTSYTLTAAQWATVDAAPGVKEFVITGSDLMDPTGAAYAGLSATGPYWSDAYPFTVVVPEPGGLGLLVIAGLLWIRRRRVL